MDTSNTTPTPESSTGAGGTMGIRRVATLLKLLAAHPAEGLRFTEVADLAGLERPTAHRVLKALEAEELVVRDPTTRRYQLGALVFDLGHATAPQFSLHEVCAPSLQRLAEASGDTAFLFVRRGNDAFCVSRVQGHFPIQTPVVAVGSRQPLGVNAGGLAVLAALPDREVEQVLKAIGPRLDAYGHLDDTGLRAAVAAARTQGFASIGDKAAVGVTAVGLAVRNRFETPVAALTIASTTGRMTLERQRELAPLLRSEVEAVRRSFDR
jgi:DNA-binding IclR family transcriptional regulator